jgi:GTP-binding protein Era
MVEPRPHGATEEEILKSLERVKKPVFLLINKVDAVKKPRLLPVIEEYAKLYPFREIIPLSALKGEGVDILLDRLLAHLPPGPKFYPDDLVTDQLERSMVSEIIREKVMEATEEEVPHAIAVEVLAWDEQPGKPIHISADIWVEREGQKGIIIGKGGRRLKKIGSAARADIERLLNSKVFLELWVRVRKGWREDMKRISELGMK